MRITLLILMMLLAAAASPASAQGYADRKDADALATIKRNLDAAREDPRLFDGAEIPAGADLRAVREHLDQLTRRVDTARRAFGELSNKAAQGPDAVRLRARFDTLTRYAQALGGAYRKAAAGADTAARQRKAETAAGNQNAHAQCRAFGDAIEPMDRTRLDQLVDIADGHGIFWQTVEDGAAFKRVIGATAALCQRQNADDACRRASPGPAKRARYCATVAMGDELLKRGVKNLLAHHAKHSGPPRADQLAARDGWIQIEGDVKWNDFFSGAALYEQLRARYQPLFDQAGLGKVSPVEMFGSLSEQYAELEAKVRELAPSWPVPGKPCKGVGCGVAKAWFARAYRGAKLVQLREGRAGWKIVKNRLDLPTHRSKPGHALLQIPGEPLCQLRSWTITETYAGGGRYQASRDVVLGYVRWQACK